MEFERVVKWSPAYDRRDPDPKKNYGIHGVELRFGLKGSAGATVFTIFTNWQLPEVQKSMEERAKRDGGMVFMLAPMPADFGYHSREACREWMDSPISGECEWTGGSCYYDGSGTYAQKVFDRFVTEGEEVIWQELETYYREIFEAKE